MAAPLLGTDAWQKIVWLNYFRFTVFQEIFEFLWIYLAISCSTPPWSCRHTRINFRPLCFSTCYLNKSTDQLYNLTHSLVAKYFSGFVRRSMHFDSVMFDCLDLVTVEPVKTVNSQTFQVLMYFKRYQRKPKYYCQKW